uniref:Putative secreted peptide n=1 Tax=Anopheles braziliensis TaxID=58242 RepID=A0A2M3ZQI2_9DIPT
MFLARFKILEITVHLTVAIAHVVQLQQFLRIFRCFPFARNETIFDKLFVLVLRPIAHTIAVLLKETAFIHILNGFLFL